LSSAENNLITVLPAKESLISEIPAEDRKINKKIYSVYLFLFESGGLRGPSVFLDINIPAAWGRENQ
jgi:hypothetical protein